MFRGFKVGLFAKRNTISLSNKPCLVQNRKFAEAEKAVLKLNFACPHVTIANNLPVSMVRLPGANGEVGITPNFVPSLTELRPGNTL